MKETMDDHQFDMPAPIYQVNLTGSVPDRSRDGKVPRTQAEKPAKPADRTPVEATDVSIDTSLDEAVDHDLAHGKEEDLLTQK